MMMMMIDINFNIRHLAAEGDAKHVINDSVGTYELYDICFRDKKSPENVTVPDLTHI